MFVKVTDGQVEKFPYSIGQLRRDNPNTSFPKTVPDAILEGYGVYKVVWDERPAFDAKTQKASIDDAPQMINGQWVLGWTVHTLTPEEKATQDAEVANQARLKRNALLSSTDWWALSDVTMTEAQAAYRQALRDITDHANWPYLEEADWPVKPE